MPNPNTFNQGGGNNPTGIDNAAAPDAGAAADDEFARQRRYRDEQTRTAAAAAAAALAAQKQARQDLANRNAPSDTYGQMLQDMLRGVRGRTAPIAPGASSVQATDLERVAGPRAYAVDPYVAARSAVGARQMSLADLLQAQASGSEDRGGREIQNEMNSQRQALLGAAQTARPGQAGGMRAALQNIASLEAGGASEAARRNADYRSQAMGALAGVLGQARAGDVSEAGNEMNAINQARGLTAQLGTTAGIAGSQLNAAQAAEQAQLRQQAALANAGYQQQAGQFGANLGLNFQGQQDQAANALLGQNLGLLSLQQQGYLTADQLAAQQKMQQAALANAWRIAQLGSETQIRLGQDSGGGWFNDLMAGVLPIAGGALGFFAGGPAGAAAGAGIGGLAAKGFSGSGGGGGGSNTIAGGFGNYGSGFNGNYAYSPYPYSSSGWSS